MFGISVKYLNSWTSPTKSNEILDWITKSYGNIDFSSTWNDLAKLSNEAGSNWRLSLNCNS